MFTDAVGQQAALLLPDAPQAVDRISSSTVLSTVAFLSSDEMAGRNTPSRELNIAAAYVAARFHGAGLEGLGDGGTFYQTHNFDTVQLPPPESAMLKKPDGTLVSVFGVIPGSKSMEQSPVIVVGPEQLASPKTSADSDPPCCVILSEFNVPPTASQRPTAVLSACRRHVDAVARAGAAVVLLECQPDSLLPELLAGLQDRSLPADSVPPSPCSILLVRSGSVTPGDPMMLTCPATDRIPNPVRNVIGVVRGRDPKLSEEAVFVTAHLDHIGTTDFGPDHINNGADDNATGVTAVVTLADSFAALSVKPRRSVVFMTFWGEEKGLRGSREFVKQPLWPLPKIRADINIEMVGRPEQGAENKIWMTGWRHSRLGELMNAGAARVGVEVFDRKDVGEMLYTRSDNYAFVEKGVVAHSFSAGSLHTDYHQPTDEWEKLNIAHMTQVIRGLFAGVLHVAESDEPVAQ
ncbi:MAG: M28 family peptidase [Planctomycetaceae bacterium]|nr:M28 family peptidase [Planctomycetaceae bacterium]